MNTSKVAITIPKDIIAVIDVLSRKTGLSRSRYISNVLREKVAEEEKNALKAKYNEIFSDESIQKEQLEMSKWFEGSDVGEGQEW